MPSKNRDSIFKINKKSSEDTNDGGRSGSFFFFTQDRQYLVKTMTGKEVKTFVKMLPSLLAHLERLKKNGENSVLARVYGLYTVKLEGVNAINLMVMRNSITKTQAYSSIPYTFDLKGSSIKRRALPRYFEKLSKKKQKILTNQIMKDEDLRKILKKVE